jgi:osmotically-inducible protein OsmY
MRRRKEQGAPIILTAALLVGVPGALATTTGFGQAGNTPPSPESRSEGQPTGVGEYLSDAWITAQVKATLLKDEGTTGLAIQVATQDGVVQLSGFVDKPEQISRAVEIAKSVKGVKRVVDDLQIKK